MNTKTDIILAEKGGSQQASSPTQAPDTLHDTSLLRIVDLLSEGEILGFVHGGTNPLQDVYLNDTPVANSDGTLNFQNVTIDSRTGTADQDPIVGFDGVDNEVSVGVELTDATPWTQAFTDLELSAIRVRLSVPQLQKTNSSNGDITGYTIDYKIELQTDGGTWETVLTTSFTGKTSSEYQRQHFIELPTATTGWTVRVTRLTANAHSAYIADTTNIVSYTEVIDAKLAYPYTAHVGITIDAKQFSTPPQRAYDIYGRIIQVPSNYDPATRAYTGVWDGTFQPAWSNNPAWIVYDLITNDRYGLGSVVSAARVNKWTLYEIAQYCDEMVDDGVGGTEPRFTMSVFIQSQADATKVLSDFVSVFRGMPYWSNSAVQVSADMPSNPVYTYTNAKVLNGKFTYQGSPLTKRYTVALVSWSNPARGGKQEVVYVPDREGIARYGIRILQITAFGTDRESQAQRLGKAALLSSRLETQVVTFGIGLEGNQTAAGAAAAPGSVINIVDNHRSGSRQAGLVSAGATTTSVPVDTVPGAVAVGDNLTVILPDGSIETQAISSIAGNVLTVGTPFSAAPQAQSVWAVETSTLQPALYKILSVANDSSGDQLKYVVTAAEYNASKFATIDSSAAPVTPPTILIPDGFQAAPASVVLVSGLVVGAAQVTNMLTIGVTAPAGAASYEYQWRRDKGQWSNVLQSPSRQIDIHNVAPGTYEASVVAVNAKGVRSAPTVSAELVVADPTTNPTNVDAIGTEASNAQAAADAANASIASISSDNVLSQPEKMAVIRDYNVITTEQAGIDAQATAYGITTEKTAYDNAVTALTSYLGGLNTPVAWNDTSNTTDIVGTTFRSNFAAVYSARQTLLNKIYDVAKTKADWSNVSSIPTPISDGRVGLGLDSSGMLNNGVTPLGRIADDSAFRKTGVGYVDSSGRPYRLWDATVGAIRDANYLYVGSARAQTAIDSGNVVVPGAIDFARAYTGKNQDNVPEGPTFGRIRGLALQNGIVQRPSGHNIVPNPTWALNTMGAGGGSHTVGGEDVCDGWITDQTGYGVTVYENTQNLYLSLRSGTVAAGAYAVLFVRSVEIAVGENVDFYMQCTANCAWNVDPPAGVNRTFRIELRCFDKTGAQLSSPGPHDSNVSSQGTNIYAYSAKTPAGTVKVVAALGIFMYNGSGAAYAITGLPFDSRPTQVAAYVKTNMDTDAVDGPIYARIKGSELSSGVHKLTVVGSNTQIGDPGNLNPNVAANYGMNWSGLSISYTATTTTGTINVSAATLNGGGKSASYGASSGTVSANGTYYLYYIDPTLSGGTLSLNITTSLNTANGGRNNILVGSVAVTIGSSGGGSGGCPVVEAWVLRAFLDGNRADQTIRAGDVKPGMYLRLRDGRAGLVTYAERKMQPCMTIIGKDGASLSCSESAPLRTEDGGSVLAANALGYSIETQHGTALIAATCTLGQREVMHITCEDDFFWTGDDPEYLFSHHNAKPPGG